VTGRMVKHTKRSAELREVSIDDCQTPAFVYCDRNLPYERREGTGYCWAFVQIGAHWHSVERVGCERSDAARMSAANRAARGVS
jgi:hypothetical protein